MSRTVTLQLPDETLQRYEQGAAAARKELADFMAERLKELAPPSTEDLPPPLSHELDAMEELDDEALWEIAQTQLSPDRQQGYDRLLVKQSRTALTPDEEKELQELGEEARRLTLKRAHAYMLLKWRGHDIPSLEALQSLE